MNWKHEGQLWKRLEERYEHKANFSGLQGYIECDFEHLIKSLGEPEQFDNYKTDAHWSIEFADGEIATIYNYKDGINYLGNEGKITYMITLWHVGGHTASAVKRVVNILELGEMDWRYS